MTFISNDDATLWKEQRTQSMADLAFTPTSVDNVEFPDDVQPQMYQNVRKVLQANAQAELSELVARHDDDDTTKCNSSTSTSSPKTKTVPPCEAASMQQRSHELTSYTPHGMPLLHRFDTCRVEQRQKTPPRRVRVNTKKGKGILFKAIPSRINNSVRGVLYDMQHKSQLPPAQSGASPSSVTTYTLTRDNRLPYLLIFFTLILILVAVVRVLRSITK